MARAARILLVDDEPSIQRGLMPLLTSRGYDVESATTGQTALTAFGRVPPDVIILDLGLPDLEGSEVCRRVRLHSPVPIIVLSVKGEEGTKVEALDSGADDYVTKPFGTDELLARVRASLRRSGGDTADVAISWSATSIATIDFDRRRVQRGADEIRLTPKEFELLAHFARHPNRVLTHHTILTTIWGVHAADHPEHLWVLVGQLRKKIEPDPGHPRYLVSEPWVGYKFVTEPE